MSALLLLLVVSLPDADEAAFVKDAPISGRSAGEAVPRLLAIAQSPAAADGVRTHAMLKLARIGDAAAVRPLIALADENDPIGRAALKALVQFGPVAVEAEPKFLAALAATDSDRRALAAEGLVRLAAVSGSSLGAVATSLGDPQLRPQTLAVLPEAPESVRIALAPRLMRLLESDDAVAAAASLPPTEPAADAVFDLLVRSLGTPDAGPIAETLAAMGKPGRQRLVRLLAGDPASQLLALRALRGATVDPDVFRPLLEAEPSVAVEAALRLIGEPKADAIVVDALGGSRRTARDVAASLAGRTLPPDLAVTLRRLRDNPAAPRQQRKLAERALKRTVSSTP